MNGLDRWEGLGVPPGMIETGLAVMVAYTASALTNGDPALICYATVVAAAGDGSWWLEVHTGAGTRLPQKFPAEQILGVPALGLKPDN